MQENIAKKHFFNYFAGNSSIFTKSEIEVWLKQPENQEQYFIWLEEYERMNTHWKDNTNIELAKIQDRIKDIDQQSLGFIEEKQNKNIGVILKYAASIVVLLSIGLYLFQDQINYKTYSTSFGSKESLQLEDGSWVILNANSKLIVPRFGFGGKDRVVKLEGEAYFSVTHKANNQKFTVNTDQNFSIEVLGTEFDVRKRGEKTQVVLEKGKVKIHYGQANDQITMRPGDKLTYDEKGKAEIEQTIQPKVYSAWRNNKFIFSRTSLNEVANLLRDNFGLNVDLPADLANRSLSGEITAKNSDELIEALSAVFELKIIKDKNTVTIRY
jgi:transmembrane sensor